MIPVLMNATYRVSVCERCAGTPIDVFGRLSLANLLEFEVANLFGGYDICIQIQLGLRRV